MPVSLYSCFNAAKDQSMAVVVEFNFSSTASLRRIMCLHENKLTCIEQITGNDVACNLRKFGKPRLRSTGRKIQ